MVGTHENQHGLTLPALLARRARGASDGRLALDAAVGLIAGALALVLRPPAWPVLVSAAACFLAFGVWGISDRAVRESPVGTRRLPALRALRAGAVIFGVLSALALAATGMGLMLGTWIS
jgi:hypothetical protein